MRLELGLNLKLSQQLRLAPQIIQSIEILQLPAMDLRELIENELQENDALEVVEPPADIVGPAEESAREPDADDLAFERDAEQILDRLDDLVNADRSGAYQTRGAGEEASDRKLEAMQNTPCEVGGLAEHLGPQLDELELEPTLRAAADAIIWNLDETGLLSTSLADVRAGLDDPIPLEVLEQGLTVVQGLDPKGVGARSLQECLLLQIDDKDPDAEYYRVLIQEHFDDLMRNKVPKVARAMGLEVQDIYDLMKGISRFSTRPGAAYGGGPVRYIRPDVIIEWEAGEYTVRLVNDYMPRVGLSPNVRKMLREARGDPKVRDYVKRKVDSAKWLIEAIAQRQSTLERVAKEIVRRQRDYLEFGVNHLRPLKMQEIADVLGIHVSTVSRAISDKHAQTSRGIVPLKFFFTGGTENEDGGVESRRSVKDRVRQIIEDEDKSSPLSDDQVAEALKEKFGLEIARRTVTKYRKALGLASSRQRRVWS